jgi:hypothetical protein
MKNEFVPYELAVKLKQLGFDEPCFAIWKNDKLISVGGHWGMNITHSMFGFEDDMFALDECRAPLFQQAFRWFREKYGLEGVTQQAEDYIWYKWKISQYNENGKKYVYDWYEYKTYEEAELVCLEKLIEIVEPKQQS